MFQSAEDSRKLGNFLQMAARLEEPKPTHDHAPDSELAMEQIDERHTPGNNIAPGLVGEHLRAKLSRSEFESFFFDEGYGFVRPFGFNPRVAKETVSFQAAVCEGFYLRHGDHRVCGFGCNVKECNLSLPCRSRGF